MSTEDHESGFLGRYGCHASQARGHDASHCCARRPSGPHRDANYVLPWTQTDQDVPFVSTGCVGPLEMPLDHLQRANALRPRLSELVRPDRCVASALPAVRRIRTDASGSTHQWPKFGTSLRRLGQRAHPP
jgi:hypothetical protein